MLDDRLSLRPFVQDDLPFLRELYASTREDELKALPWPARKKAEFLAMQFDAQHKHYIANYGEASFQIIEFDGTPVGRFYLERGEDEFRLIDIALLPAYRNRGFGSYYMKRLLDEARASDKPVRIHVEKFNPALRLYERLDFKKLEDRGVYWFMEWRPVARQAKTASY